MAFPKHHGIQLALNSWIENLHIERLATDPAVTVAGRIWFNTTDKVVRFSSLDAAGAVVIKSIADQASLDAAIASLDSKLNTEITNRTNADSAIQSELDATQTGAGLGANGAYTAPASSNYLATAASLADALVKLDAALKSASDAAAKAQSTADSKVSKAGDTMTGSLIMSAGTHVSIADQPTADLHAVNKAYVEARVAGLKWKQEVKAATVSSIANLSSVSQAGTSFLMDGVAIVTGDRVAIKDGASPDGVAAVSAAHNGLYVAEVTVDPADKEVSTLTITAAPTAIGNVTVTLDGTSYNIAVDPAIETTAASVAAKIRAGAYTGFVTSGTGADVVFTAATEGPKADTTYAAGTTGATGSVVTNVQGDSAVTTAKFVRSTDADAISELVSASVFVSQGATNADVGYTITVDAGATLGTSPIPFVQFNGAANVVAGVGLSKTGNQIDVNLGAGIAQLPTDEVGIDVKSDGGLFLTVDGVAASTDTAAQLSVKLDGTSLSKSAAGVKVADSVIADIASKASQTEVDAIEAGAGLNADGTYSADATTNYIATAASLKDADKKLDAQLKTVSDQVAAGSTTSSNIQSELDKTQAGAGLAADGAYAANAAANYIAAATSLKDADNKLDAQVKVNTDAIATKASQAEVDATQAGAGLNADGTYAANATANYIAAATSLKDADNKLDAQLKTVADEVAANKTAAANGDAALQAELDKTQTGAGLAADGAYVTEVAYAVNADGTNNGGAHYIDGAASLKAADKVLDTALKGVDDRVATLEANSGAGAEALKKSINDGRFTYKSSVAAATHTVTHNLNAEFLSFSVMVQGADGVFRNDIVPVEETNLNTLTIALSESRNIKVVVANGADIA